MPKKVDHLHKYQRSHPWGRKKPIYRCMVPGCTHYTLASLILNRICECWRCGNAMVIDKRASGLAKPHCLDCVKSKKDKTINKLAGMFE